MESRGRLLFWALVSLTAASATVLVAESRNHQPAAPSLVFQRLVGGLGSRPEFNLGFFCAVETQFIGLSSTAMTPVSKVYGSNAPVRSVLSPPEMIDAESVGSQGNDHAKTP